MTRYKNFGSPVAISSDEVITFDLYGEGFKCKPHIQGKALIDLMKDAGEDGSATSATMIFEFLDHVLESDSRAKLYEMMESTDKIVPVETLGEIVGWLVEEYTGRPEEPREA